MSRTEVLQSLDISWSRDEVLSKLQSGTDPDEIIKDFLSENKKEIEKLINLFSNKDREILKNIEELSTCEARLINKINHYSFSEEKSDSNQSIGIIDTLSRKNFITKLGPFMTEWSNKFVFIVLVTISAIALSKQAWA